MATNKDVPLILENDCLRVKVALMGGHIEEICNKKTGYRCDWPYRPALWPRRTSVCFPICGSLPQDSYTYNKSRYHMPTHGFLREQKLTAEIAEADSATLILRDSPKTLESYPFRFCFRLEYRLAGSTLQVSYAVKNEGETAMLYSVGAHYAYQLPLAKDADSCVLELENLSHGVRVKVKNGLHIGETPVSLQPVLPLPRLDGDSIVLRCPPEGWSQVLLRNHTTGHNTRVGFSGFSHCLLWAPFPEAPFLCIEPWAGSTGRTGETRLEEKPDILSLAAGCESVHQMEITPE